MIQISKYVYIEDLVTEKFPGTIARAITQFSGTFWEPQAVGPYIAALYDLNDSLQKMKTGTTEIVSFDNWPVVYGSSTHKPRQTLAEILSNTFPERDFSECADYWAEVISTAWSNECYERIFDLFVGSEGEYQKYHIPYEDSDRDDIIDIYYPTGKYTEEEIKVFVKSKRGINSGQDYSAS